jgi:hypothetical protein
LDCVVALGNRQDDGSTAWAASGFLYGTLIDGSVPPEKRMYNIVLVTNRHVHKQLTRPVARFNPQGQDPARELDLALEVNGEPAWALHPNPEVDVAVTPIVFNYLKEQNIVAAFFQSDTHSLTTAKLFDAGASEGDGVFLLGFPMGLVGGPRNAVIVRGGWLARLRDLRDGSSDRFLVDSWVFPGNSGGPVVTRPEAMSIQGTKSPLSANLIGVLSSYLPFIDVAVSQQTNRPRITFEENSGLVNVFPVDCIDQTIALLGNEPLAADETPVTDISALEQEGLDELR